MKVRTYTAFVAFAILAAGKVYGAEAICGNLTVIFCEDFENDNLRKWQDGYDPNRHTITTDPTNVYQGQKALEVTYPAGADGGWLTRWFMPGYESADQGDRVTSVYLRRCLISALSKSEGPWLDASFSEQRAP